MTKYIIYTKKAGYQFAPKDGETMTEEQVARYRNYDNEADTVAELTRQYKVQLDGGFRNGGSDNETYYDDAIIAQFKAEAAEEGINEDYSFYTIPGYYENNVLTVSDDQLAKGIGSFESNNATSTYIVEVEVEEEEEEEDFDRFSYDTYNWAVIEIAVSDEEGELAA